MVNLWKVSHGGKAVLVILMAINVGRDLWTLTFWLKQLGFSRGDPQKVAQQYTTLFAARSLQPPRSGEQAPVRVLGPFFQPTIGEAGCMGSHATPTKSQLSTANLLTFCFAHVPFLVAPKKRITLSGQLVGSLDFNLLVETTWVLPRGPQKVRHFLQRGRCSNQARWKRLENGRPH